MTLAAGSTGILAGFFSGEQRQAGALRDFRLLPNQAPALFPCSHSCKESPAGSLTR